MFKIALILVSVCVAISYSKDLRIKGAKPAKINDYPSMASVSSKENFVCHGIILSKRVIMAPASK